MKSEKGITLTSLAIYIMVTLIVLGILATITASFRSNVIQMNKEGTGSSEIDKFNMYFLKEVKKQGNEISSISNTSVSFTSGNTYTFNSTDEAIYLSNESSNIKIAEEIESCTFSSNLENGKTVITATIKAFNVDERTIEYVVSGDEIAYNYEDESNYTSEGPKTYAKNGLILWLDGIDKGNTEGKWIDKASELEFILTGDYTFEDTSVHFTNASADCSTIINPVTLEIVLKNENNGYGTVFTNNIANQSVVFNNSKYIQTGGGSYKKSYPSMQDTIINYTICFNSNKQVTKCYKNGQLQTEGGSTESWGATYTGTRIGKYGTGNYPFVGNIYCIRAYDRELTEEEIRSNHKIDIQRFGVEEYPKNTPYVNDGLTLWLDGIQKGSLTNKWTDQVSGRKFTMTGTYTFNNTSVHFTNARAENNNILNPVTFEIVLKNEKNGYGTVFINNNNNQSIVFNNSNFIQIGGGNYKKSYASSQNTIINYTICFDSNKQVIKCYKNGQIQTEGGSTESWGSTYNGTKIGQYSNNYPFVGDIYSIRMYNRELTDEEIQSNYLIDRQRFGF